KIVSRPLQIARVGDSTRSITRLNGSSTPLARSVSRVRMISSNLENRSRCSPVSTGGRSAWLTPSLIRGSLRCQLAHRVDQLAVRLDLGLLVHADDDVELVLDRRDEIHDR